LNVQSVYEPSTFKVIVDGREIWYTPDFELPELNAFVEIKYEQKAPLEACRKCKALAVATGKNVLLFWSPPWQRKTTGSAYCYKASTGDFEPNHRWTTCPICAKSGVTAAGVVGDLICGCEQRHKELSNASSALIIEAIAKAKAARFF